MERVRNGLLAALTGCLAAFAGYDVWYWVSAFFAAPLAQDTSLYYVAAQIGLEHGWSRIYNLLLQAQVFAGLQAGFTQSDFFLYANPPPMAWLMAPLTVAPPVAAYLAVVAISGCAVVGAGLMAAPGTGRVRVLFVLAPFAWYPVIYGLRLGQVTLLVGFLIVLCWWLDQRGRPELAGLVLALTAIKPQLALLVGPCLLLAGHWRLALGWLAGSLILAGASVLSLGADGVAQYIDVLRIIHGADYNQVFSLASLGGGPAITIALQVAAAAVTLAAAFRSRRRETAVVIAVALIGGLLAAPYAHVDDFAIVLPAAWLLVRAGRALYHVLWLIPLAVTMELAWVLGPFPILATLAICLLLFFVPSAELDRRVNGADHHPAMVA